MKVTFKFLIGYRFPDENGQTYTEAYLQRYLRTIESRYWLDITS